MNKLIKTMVDRFLGWTLPRDFGPDAGISFKPPENPQCWPVGTNILTANQAKGMFEDVLNSVADDADKWRMAQLLGIVTPEVEKRIAKARG